MMKLQLVPFLFIELLSRTHLSVGIVLTSSVNKPVCQKYWELVCSIESAITKNVVITKPDGSSAASCTPAIPPFPASCTNAVGYTASIDNTAFTVVLTTNSLPVADNGTWICTYNPDTTAYTLDTIMCMSELFFEVNPTTSGNLTSSSQTLSLSVLFGCINVKVQYKWLIVDINSQTEVVTTSSVFSNNSICTSGYFAYKQAINSSLLFETSRTAGLDGTYKLRVEVYYNDEKLNSTEYLLDFIFSYTNTTNSTTLPSPEDERTTDYSGIIIAGTTGPGGVIITVTVVIVVIKKRRKMPVKCPKETNYQSDKNCSGEFDQYEEQNSNQITH